MLIYVFSTKYWMSISSHYVSTFERSMYVYTCVCQQKFDINAYIYIVRHETSVRSVAWSVYVCV